MSRPASLGTELVDFVYGIARESFVNVLVGGNAKSVSFSMQRSHQAATGR